MKIWLGLGVKQSSRYGVEEGWVISTFLTRDLTSRIPSFLSLAPAECQKVCTLLGVFSLGLFMHCLEREKDGQG